MPEIDKLDVSVYTVPTEEPESDGTLTWNATTMVLAEPSAAGKTGLGFSYATGACARLIKDVLEDAVVGQDAMDVGRCWSAMVRAIRNLGRPGVASMAIAAVDVGLWDLKSKLINLPLVKVLGQVRDEVPVYGSGGFTSFTDDQLANQLGSWAHGQGITRVKMKVGEAWGSRLDRDLERQVARATIGDYTELFVDANGGYTPKQAVRMAKAYEALGVTWFEEPVSSDHLGALAEVRARPPSTWLPVSTATTCSTSPPCARRARSTASRQTSPAAPGSPNGSAWPRWPRATDYKSLATVLNRSPAPGLRSRQHPAPRVLRRSRSPRPNPL